MEKQRAKSFSIYSLWSSGQKIHQIRSLLIMKIYFAGSIRGGREKAGIYSRIIIELRKFGKVLTEHIGDPHVDDSGEKFIRDQFIYKRDMQWLHESDLLVAEVSIPSLGVGYEIGRAEQMAKPVICLYHKSSDRPLSAMIAGNPYIKLLVYSDIDELEGELEALFRQL